MKQHAIAGLILAAAGMLNLRGACADATSFKLKPGKYALTITYEVQGQRQDESPSAARCIRPRDLDNPEKVFSDRIAAEGNEGACSVRNLKSANGQISYDADCSNRTVHVEGNLNNTGFAVVRTVTPKASAGVTLKFTVTGTRTGDCPAIGKR